MPDNPIGILVALTALGPGYIFVIRRARRIPTGQRSALLELAEILLVGAVCSLTAALLAVSALLAMGLIDRAAMVHFAIDPVGFLLAEEWRLVLAAFMALVVLAVSCLLAASLARVLYGKLAANIYPNGTAWRQVFGDLSKTVALTVELRDGRQVAGVVRGYTVSDEADRLELTLASPLSYRVGKGEAKRLDGEFFVVEAGEIVYMAGKYIT